MYKLSRMRRSNSQNLWFWSCRGLCDRHKFQNAFEWSCEEVKKEACWSAHFYQHLLQYNFKFFSFTWRWPRRSKRCILLFVIWLNYKPFPWLFCFYWNYVPPNMCLVTICHTVNLSVYPCYVNTDIINNARIFTNSKVTYY